MEEVVLKLMMCNSLELRDIIVILLWIREWGRRGAGTEDCDGCEFDYYSVECNM